MSDRLFDALADRQRRRLLAAFLEHAPEEGESVVLDVDTIEAHGLSRVELYHVHLPKLADAGVVEWNRETDEIAAGPRFDQAHQLLGLACGRQDGAFAD